MKMRRRISVFLLSCILFCTVLPTAVDFLTSAEKPAQTERSFDVGERNLGSDDPNWLPPEARLTEDEIAALDPPPITDEELAAASELLRNGKGLLKDIVSNSLSDTESAEISNVSLYDDSLKNYDLAGKPTVAIYNHVYWDLSDKPLEEIASAARKSGSVDYVVLTDDTLLRITQYADAETGAYTLGIRTDMAGWNFGWVHDLLITEIKNNFGEGDCTIKQVYCFDDSSSRMGILVYFVTDNGNYVKYYRGPDSVEVVHTEEEFRSCAKYYYEDLASFVNGHAPDEELSG